MMRNNHYPGKLIAFEGLDGSGLSTQAKLLVEFLNESRNTFDFPGAWYTKEPTKSLIGGLINAQLDQDWKSSNECLQLLFSADRAYHLEKKIIPKLKRGVVVVCDRYLFSSVAFGGLDINDPDWLLSLQDRFLMPDLTFFLKVSPKECLRRIKENRLDTTLFEKEKVFEKVWQNYEHLAERFQKSNVRVVEGERPIEKVSKEIKNITKRSFKL